MKKMSIKAQSLQRDERTVRCHIRPELGFYYLDNIDKDMIQDLLDKKKKELAYSSHKKLYDCLNASLRYAENSGRIANNPVKLVGKPTARAVGHSPAVKPEDLLTNEEIKRFEESVYAKYSNGKPRFKNGGIFILMLNTGVRIGEATSLKKTDYNRKHSTLLVDSSLVMRKDEEEKHVVIDQEGTKTNEEGSRVIKLNSKSIEVVEAAIATSKSKYLFCTNDGAPIRHGNAQRGLDAILRHAGLPHKTTHILRHCFATRHIEKGTPVHKLSKMLGHMSVRVTYDTYVHILNLYDASTMKATEDLYE